MTEYWVSQEIYCPACGQNMIRSKSNQPVQDFVCQKCSEEFELKSKKDKFSSQITDGAYSTMIERLVSNNNPNFLLLNYQNHDFKITNFFVIPKYFFTPDLIVKRPALSTHAKRSGWTGCNISLVKIPEIGKIHYIKNQQIISKENVIKKWQKTAFLNENMNFTRKGWLLDILLCIEALGKKKFTLDEMYMFEKDLMVSHPANRHVKDKIRQQLQILRDKEFLEFGSRGNYRVL